GAQVFHHAVFGLGEGFVGVGGTDLAQASFVELGHYSHGIRTVEGAKHKDHVLISNEGIGILCALRWIMSHATGWHVVKEEHLQLVGLAIGKRHPASHVGLVNSELHAVARRDAVGGVTTRHGQVNRYPYCVACRLSRYGRVRRYRVKSWHSSVNRWR